MHHMKLHYSNLIVELREAPTTVRFVRNRDFTSLICPRHKPSQTFISRFCTRYQVLKTVANRLCSKPYFPITGHTQSNRCHKIFRSHLALCPQLPRPITWEFRRANYADLVSLAASARETNFMTFETSTTGQTIFRLKENRNGTNDKNAHSGSRQSEAQRTETLFKQRYRLHLPPGKRCQTSH